ncbi:hypothetical protein EVAR_81029_1 [Eumeta japonica]|uniref:Uncharacterized protein n=1 Tax=Eumeta variegata TaxID=151549 RepID=A0A4C1T6C1_EUMVA|nr:hypothetical protein EVAR_81029_1 [Eumeta japonica]
MRYQNDDCPAQMRGLFSKSSKRTFRSRIRSSLDRMFRFNSMAASSSGFKSAGLNLLVLLMHRVVTEMLGSKRAGGGEVRAHDTLHININPRSCALHRKNTGKPDSHDIVTRIMGKSALGQIREQSGIDIESGIDIANSHRYILICAYSEADEKWLVHNKTKRFDARSDDIRAF